MGGVQLYGELETRMSLDTVLAIAALALCIGQVAAARKMERKTTILVGPL